MGCGNCSGTSFNKYLKRRNDGGIPFLKKPSFLSSRNYWDKILMKFKMKPELRAKCLYAIADTKRKRMQCCIDESVCDTPHATFDPPMIPYF